MVGQLGERNLDEGAEPLPREDACSVLEVRREHLVARLQVECAGRHVHARGRVLDEREVVALRPDVGAELGINAVRR